MPEEFENQEISENAEQEQQSEVEAKEEAKVPVHVVQELREELKAAREENKITRSQMANLMGEYQKALAGQKNKAQEMQEALDPEIQKALEPFLRPLKAEIQSAREELDTVRRSKDQIEAERYIERNLPNLGEIRAPLTKYIESVYTPEEAAELSPKEIVRLGKFVTQMEQSKKGVKTQARSQARSETGSVQNRPDTQSSDIDARVKEWIKEKGL